jgi:hypothetical protein
LMLMVDVGGCRWWLTLMLVAVCHTMGLDGGEQWCTVYATEMLKLQNNNGGMHPQDRFTPSPNSCRRQVAERLLVTKYCYHWLHLITMVTNNNN